MPPNTAPKDAARIHRQPSPSGRRPSAFQLVSHRCISPASGDMRQSRSGRADRVASRNHTTRSCASTRRSSQCGPPNETRRFPETTVMDRDFSPRQGAVERGEQSPRLAPSGRTAVLVCFGRRGSRPATEPHRMLQPRITDGADHTYAHQHDDEGSAARAIAYPATCLFAWAGSIPHSAIGIAHQVVEEPATSRRHAAC